MSSALLLVNRLREVDGLLGLASLISRRNLRQVVGRGPKEPNPRVALPEMSGGLAEIRQERPAVTFLRGWLEWVHHAPACIPCLALVVYRDALEALHVHDRKRLVFDLLARRDDMEVPVLGRAATTGARRPFRVLAAHAMRRGFLLNPA